MSREIKFRAWDRRRQKMLCDAIRVGKALYWDGCKCFTAITDFDANPPRHEIMQFTGLRDKNGKEIYEGDILRNNCDMTFPITVDDLHGYRFMFGVDNLTAYDSKGEVIGNIYENPELLEEK